jgi:hypothetical protein
MLEEAELQCCELVHPMPTALTPHQPNPTGYDPLPPAWNGYIHHHRYPWAHIDLIQAARDARFRACDCIVKYSLVQGGSK